jgi:hypothetical protein
MLSVLIPGPYSYKELDTFLQPLVEELLILHTGVPDTPHKFGPNFTLKAHCIHCAGDGPAIADLMGCKKPGVALQACPRCFMHGQRCGAKGPFYLPHSVELLDKLPLKEHYRELIELWTKIRPKYIQDEYGKALGITKRSALIDLPTLHFPNSFPLDLMHCVLQNLVPQLHQIWGGHIDKDGDLVVEKDDEEPLQPLCKISKKEWEQIADLQEKSRTTTPHLLGSGQRRIDKHWKGFKAIEWREWLCRDGIPIMCTVLGKDKFKEQILHFVLLRKIYLTATKWNITRTEVVQLRLDCKAFVLKWQELYYKRRLDLLKNCRINLHALLHLGYISPSIWMLKS